MTRTPDRPSESKLGFFYCSVLNAFRVPLEKGSGQETSISSPSIVLLDLFATTLAVRSPSGHP